jgi:hypothetical protein
LKLQIENDSLMFLNIEEAVPVIGYVIISKTDQGMELLKKINKILADNITGTIYNLQLQNYDVQLIERFLARSVPISCASRIRKNPRHIHGYAPQGHFLRAPVVFANPAASSGTSLP